MTDLTLDLPPIFPTVPGCVEGIVNRDPIVVQCPDCGDCFTGLPILAVSAVPWNRRSGIKGRRCLHCWTDYGIYESDYHSVTGDPVAARKALLTHNMSWDRDRISAAEAQKIIEGKTHDET